MRIFVIVIAFLFFGFFMLFLFPHDGQINTYYHSTALFGYYVAIPCLALPIYFFVYQGMKNCSRRLVLLSSLSLLLAMIAPIVSWQIQLQDKSGSSLSYQWSNEHSRHIAFTRRHKSVEPRELIEGAKFLRMYKKQIAHCHEFMDKVKKAPMSDTRRTFLLQEIKQRIDYLARTHREYGIEFLTVSKAWLQDCLSQVEGKGKEERDKKRWLISDVYLELDKKPTTDVATETLLLYQRVQRELGSPEKFLLESRGRR